MVLYLVIRLLFSTVMPHPIHISVSEVEITSQEISWTSRIYTDDLLLGIYGKNADVTMLGEPDKIRRDILDYLTKNVTVTIDDKVLEWKLQDVQPDPEAIWITMTSSVSHQSMSSMRVRNNILLDVYRDQKNVVNLSWINGKKNIVFEKGDDQKLVSLL